MMRKIKKVSLLLLMLLMHTLILLNHVEAIQNRI